MKMQPNTKPARLPLNGVDTPNLLATINFVAGQPELAKFQFRAHNEWIEGTHSKTVMNGFFGAGQEQRHEKPHYADADHPAILCGADAAPTPVEWLLHGLAGCLMAGVANIAAARGIKLTKVKCSVDGDIDLRGILGISDEVRNGFQNIQVSFEIEGDAPAEKLQQLVEQSRARSAVFDVLTKGVPVTVGIKTIQ
ncbi:MAG: OsmC family peroxiredoxin [Hyphomicrobiales bacterium]|nr:MAG: OsmC family peroxiredoxin [Hyphomicrobiales bacterium]